MLKFDYWIEKEMKETERDSAISIGPAKNLVLGEKW
jgi:hypothetical protein